MDSSSLTAGSGNGSLSSTESPQTGAQGNAGGTNINSLQPNIASKDLVSSVGIPLNSSALPTVSLGSTHSTTNNRSSQAATVSHHKVSTTLLGGLVLILVVAVALFWWIKNSANNTT